MAGTWFAAWVNVNLAIFAGLLLWRRRWCRGRDLNPGHGLERPAYWAGLYYRGSPRRGGFRRPAAVRLYQGWGFKVFAGWEGGGV